MGMQSATPCSFPLTASGRFYKLCAQILQPSFRRHQSSYRRARSKLNIKPDASFLPSQTDQHDHIVHNPPPSMPNVYHTPNIFLPDNDRRKIIPDPETSKAQLLLSQQIPAMKGQQEQQKLVTEIVKSRWGKKRREAREDRELRKE